MTMRLIAKRRIATGGNRNSKNYCYPIAKSTLWCFCLKSANPQRRYVSNIKKLAKK